MAAHVSDFDDPHMESTTHISAVGHEACGGRPRELLASAGVMARLGAALGRPPSTAGWHATYTAGAQ